MKTSQPPTTQPRSRQVKFRLTEAEFAQLAKSAKRRKRTISEVVRFSLSLDSDTPPVLPSGASKKTGTSGLDAPG